MSISLFACQGQIGDDKGLERVPGTTQGNQTVSGTGAPPGGGVYVTNPSGVAVTGFALPLTQPQLLPFSVRLARVAAVVGLPRPTRCSIS